jgi:hypothetical protein
LAYHRRCSQLPNEGICDTFRDWLTFVEKAYKLVREAISALASPVLGSRGWQHHTWALFMAIEHERIHLETSSVLMRELPDKYLLVPKHWPVSPNS